MGKLNDYTFCLDNTQKENYSNRNNVKDYHYIFLLTYIKRNEYKMEIDKSLSNSKENIVKNEIQKNNDINILNEYQEYIYMIIIF